MPGKSRRLTKPSLPAAAAAQGNGLNRRRAAAPPANFASPSLPAKKAPRPVPVAQAIPAAKAIEKAPKGIHAEPDRAAKALPAEREKREAGKIEKEDAKADAKPPGGWAAPAGIVRRKKTPALAASLGLLGVVGLIAFGVVGAITFAVNLSMRHPITNSLGMTLLYCPPGSFTMGSPTDEKDRSEDEDQVSVTISKGFYLGKYSVTQAEFKSVMGTSPWR